jgi:pimeloyl-ACP methyl ester carboxylesterase
MLDEKTFDTGELILNYGEAGGSGSPLVLLHGLTANKNGYAPLISGLASNWHIYAPDFRGHGKSGRAPDNHYRNADYARDIIAFLKQIGEPVLLMGHSLGAMVSIVTAAQYPGGVSGVVLLDPPLYSYTGNIHLQPDAEHWFSLVTSVMKDNPSYDTVVARLRAQMPDVSDEQIEGMASMISSVAAGTTETALRDEIWQGVDLPQALQKIKCRVLLIHGDWNAGAVMREEDIDFFKANCPAATTVHLPGADHGLKMQEQPNLVLQPVRAMFQSP